MATSYEGFTGAIVAIANLKAIPRKSDEVAQYLLKLRARAESDIEPGTLRYSIVRYEDSFSVWEEYAGPDAVKWHLENTLLQEFRTRMPELLIEIPVPEFYAANSLDV